MSPNALTIEQVKVLLNLLETIRQRPKSYVGSEDLVKSLDLFLLGIRTFAQCLSGFDGFMFSKTALLRGWGMTPRAPYRVMQDEGLADKAVVEELLMIDVETYKRIFGIENIESVDKLPGSQQENQIAATTLAIEQVKILLNRLESFRWGIKFFTGSQDNAEAAHTFLMGIRTFARHLSGFDESATFVETASRRGWPITPKDVVMIMREKNFSGEAIIEELITIEVETYKQIFDME